MFLCYSMLHFIDEPNIMSLPQCQPISSLTFSLSAFFPFHVLILLSFISFCSPLPCCNPCFPAIPHPLTSPCLPAYVFPLPRQQRGIYTGLLPFIPLCYDAVPAFMDSCSPALSPVEHICLICLPGFDFCVFLTSSKLELSILPPCSQSLASNLYP